MKAWLIISLLLANFCGAAENATPAPLKPLEADDSRWWPMQVLPKAFVRTTNHFSSPHAACEMMVQSVAGLAAKAVNEGRGDEMVWVGTDNVDEEDWFARKLNRHPQFERRGTFDPWTLVERYAKRGIIKGYIL